MAIDYKKLLNKEQYQVVNEADGHCLVLAGAGSGKTRTLVFRVAYLLEIGVNADNILLVTFTNKAAHEMMSRVENLIETKLEKLWGGTFHHIGNLILRRHAEKLGYERNYSILDEEDSVNAVKNAMVNLNLETNSKYFPKPSVVRSIISYARNVNLDVKETAEDYFAFPEFVSEKIAEIAVEYGKKKKQANAMDFDDLLINWLELLENFPEINKRYSEQFEYILVDEYQDTNFVQAEIIKKLAWHHHNVLVVGDDSQSIYSFRAADVKNILNFPKLFPDVKVFRIERNYRSTPPILDLANDIIHHNAHQFKKSLIAERSGIEKPLLVACRDEYQQANFIVRRIMQLYRDGKDYCDMAVLYRSNFQAAELQLELSKNNIPYIVRGGMRYFEQAHIKDVLSYLKVFANFRDEIAWRRLLMMHGGMGKMFVENFSDKIKSFNNLEEIMSAPFEFRGRVGESWQAIRRIFQFFMSIDRSKSGFISSAIEYLMSTVYEEYLKNNYEDYRDRLDDLNQLINFTAMYADLEKLLADVLLSESFQGETGANEKSVILSTIHQAKGLEWPIVFIIGLRDGNFPHYKSMEKDRELEEERRLFYVAATRAKDELTLLYPMRSFSYKYGEVNSGPSMFIRELSKDKYSWLGGYRRFEESDDEKVIEYD